MSLRIRKPDETTFDAANATVEGTWANKVFTSDMAAVAGYLKLLKDAGIPVLWRPFHEAAGKWFWWGKDAASHKAMWIAMFNYFKAQGLDNKNRRSDLLFLLFSTKTAIQRKEHR